MDTSTHGAVVVGVTGPGRETAALRFAAAVALREDAEVVLAHAFTTALPASPPSVLLTYAEASDVAQWIGKGVREELEQLTHGTVRSRTLVVAGPPARVLADLGRGAHCVVVQHRQRHLLDRVFVGSTANGTAAHCACPVISVPEGWEEPAAEEPLGDVVVGVHEGGVPRQALDAAFDWAAATGARLRVVHAWRLDPSYDDIITPRVADEWRERQVRDLTTALQGLREQHADVPVEIEVHHHWPTEVLVEASDDASMVVVGRHAHGWAGERLGSVARTVLREARGPVMVVPVDRHHDDGDWSGDWGLVADEVSPQT